MKNNLVKLGLTVGLSTTLLGYTYQINEGWQQLGAIQDTNLSIFDDKCIDYLWYYDNSDNTNPQWKLHISNGTDYGYCGETIDTLSKGQGFWAKANGDCNITIADTSSCQDDNCTDEMPAPPNIENPECYTCDSNVSGYIGSIATGEPATTTVLYTNTNHLGGGDITYAIMPDKDSFATNYVYGYFYDETNSAEIKIDQSFKLWPSLSDSYATYVGQLKITNLNTNEIIITNPYPNPADVSIYYEMTDVLPAGTYRFEKAGTTLNTEDIRIDDGWFFAKYE